MKLHRLHYLGPLVILALGLVPAQEPRPATYSPRANAKSVPDEEPRVVEAAALWNNPGAHVGELLSLEVQFQSETESWNPLMTRFGPGEYRAFSAWSEEQFLWHKPDFDNPRVRVFAGRGGAAEWALKDAERLARFELLCRVQSSFAGRPWVEVLAVKPRLRSLQEGSLIHAVRGLEHVEKGLWKAALTEFERANSDGLPKRARAELERLAEFCRKRVPIQLGERINK